MPRTPSLDALRIFVVAARHLSFTDAASQLNRTQSAVSHRIRGLEEELGFALFRRLTRRLELTPQGRALARKVGNAISEIDHSIVELERCDDGASKIALFRDLLIEEAATPAIPGELRRSRQTPPENPSASAVRREWARRSRRS